MSVKKKKLVLEITPQNCYKPFKSFGECTHNHDLLWSDRADQIALVVFTGGTDVNPSLYGEPHGEFTDHSDHDRDEHEKNVFYRANTLGIPMVGICRGSQFLCVMAGGKLVQHVNNHGGFHNMKTHDDRIIQVNSTHHQMQLPPEGARILGYAEPRRSTVYLNGKNQDIKKLVPCDVEVVYYQNINAIGIQFHPEWLQDDHECNLYAIQIVNEFLLGNK